MRLAATLVVGIIGCTNAWAQLPQAAWEGEVDGRVEITIRGDRMDIRELAGSPVSALKYRVYDPLPARSGQVRLQVQQSRGSVRITQQPGASNNYSAVVVVEDSQGGRSLYSFQLFWDVDVNVSGSGPRRYTIVDDRTPAATRLPDVGRPAVPSQSGSYARSGGDYLRWTGTVDDEAVIECRQRDCYPVVQRGANVARDRVEYSRPLPARQEVRVDLTDAQGRGEVRMLEQGNSRNRYTTRVRIRDPQGGAGDYAFILRWTSLAELEREAVEFGMRWMGRVDGKARVILEGSRAYTETLAGSRVTDERATFDRALPAIEGLSPRLNKKRGRGRVELVEYPSRRNGFRLVFTIDDEKGGSDLYEVEVGW